MTVVVTAIYIFLLLILHTSYTSDLSDRIILFIALFDLNLPAKCTYYTLFYTRRHGINLATFFRKVKVSPLFLYACKWLSEIEKSQLIDEMNISFFFFYFSSYHFFVDYFVHDRVNNGWKSGNNRWDQITEIIESRIR